jgi:hypothetical protein
MGRKERSTKNIIRDDRLSIKTKETRYNKWLWTLLKIYYQLELLMTFEQEAEENDAQNETKVA